MFFALLVGAALSACCGNGSDGAPGTIDGEITVFAASSLSEAFKEAAAFEKANPGTEVTFSFAASSALAVQINEGAPADVFASADTAQMKSVIDQGNAEEPTVFATNTPVVVVPKDGKAVATFADIAKPGIKLVLAGKDVPIGRYAREILAKASGTGGISPDFSDRVLANLKSEEANVRAVLAKIQLGEADAGVVYRTDIVAAAGDVRIIEIPAPYNVLAEYSIAVVWASTNQVNGRGIHGVRPLGGWPGDPGEVRLRCAVGRAGALP
ncbi:MAG: molybdate ABC transporter substrate-binding protein [Dehalococcoidia bacterium]|nr:molybdate ABC transporter substrate-binding protein [Dehalococcoidia bacterium]